MSRLWPHVRAWLIVLHVVAITLQALPAPGGAMSRSAWKDPTVQDEIAIWAERLGTTPADLEERMWRLGSSWMDVRRSLLTPFQPYYRYAGTAQSWRMFVAPHRYPARLHVEVHQGGAWRPVYVARSREHDWLRRELDNDRMRSAVFRYAWPAYARSYKELVDWLADRAAEDFPEARAVRVRFAKARTPTPAEARAGVEPESDWVRTRIWRLE